MLPVSCFIVAFCLMDSFLSVVNTHMCLHISIFIRKWTKIGKFIIIFYITLSFIHFNTKTQKTTLLYWDICPPDSTRLCLVTPHKIYLNSVFAKLEPFPMDMVIYNIVLFCLFHVSGCRRIKGLPLSNVLSGEESKRTRLIPSDEVYNLYIM